MSAKLHNLHNYIRTSFIIFKKFIKNISVLFNLWYFETDILILWYFDSGMLTLGILTCGFSTCGGFTYSLRGKLLCARLLTGSFCVKVLGYYACLPIFSESMFFGKRLVPKISVESNHSSLSRNLYTKNCV